MNNKIRRTIVVASVALVTAVGAATQLRAQTFATVAGFVTDQSAAAIPGVGLKLQNEATGEARTTQSGSGGEYTFTLIPPGTYTLVAAKSGFTTATTTGLAVEVNATMRRDVTLQLASTQQQITVQASAVQVNTETADLGAVVGSAQTAQLPLNGRDFLQLSLLSAGVAPPPVQNGQSTAQSGTLGGGRQTEVVDVSGTREVSEIVMFDGIPEKQFFYGLTALQPPVDSIAEFKIQEGYFSPQFYSPAIINVVMKSGTNSLHGAAWEFVRNSDLNARNFFDINRAPFKQNQFGASAGGPAIKNKVFWFGDYEGLRLLNYTSQYLIEPTAAEVGGNFTGLPPIINPATSQPFPQNIIPSGDISAFATAYNKFIPAPNTAPIAALGGANLAGQVDTPQIDNKWDVKGDVDLRSSDRIFARVSRISSSVNTNSLDPVQGLLSPLTGDNVAIGWTHVFSPSIVNEFRGGLDRAFLVSGTPSVVNANFSSQLGLANAGGIPQCNGVPDVGLTGYSGQGEGNGNCIINGNSDKLLVDNLNIVRGKHTVTVGFDIRRVNWKMLDSYVTVGDFTFTGQYTGNSVADYLLGDANTVTGGLANEPTYRRAVWPSIYFNDAFHATSKLTVNYGVSWVYTPPPGELYDNLYGFDFNQDAMVRCGTQLNGIEMPRGCFDRHHFDFAPRLGLAYSPAKNWAVRGSYGVFWDRIPGNEWVWSSIYYPFQSSYSAVGGPTEPVGLTGLFPPAPPPGGAPAAGTSLFNIGPPNRKDPYIQQWTASVEHTLPGNIFLELAYVGSKGTHLSKRIDANLDPTLATTPAEQALSVQQRRPYQPFGFFLSDQARANSEYDALQFTARKPIGHGLSFITGLTYSKSLDDDSYDEKRPGTTAPVTWTKDSAPST